MITKSKIQQLCNDCKKLLFYSEKIEENQLSDLLEYNRDIKKSLRKLIIANEISDRMIICVTGLQGTGKTTLMKNYYELDDSVMNIALGRGERLPVLITEDAVSQPAMYAVGIEKTSDGYETRRTVVNNKDFIEFSKAENEDSTIMYMELIVPWKYHNEHEKVSYMLLPGYEKKESYWNSLIEFSVQCSDTAIFVLTPEKVADVNNAQLLERIGSQFGKNVIYTISHSDEKADENKNMKETLMKLIGASAEDEKRFVCVGAYTEKEKNGQWKQQLQEAISIYSANPYAMEQKSIDYIERIICEELRPAVAMIKKSASDKTSEILNGFEQSLWLTSFDAEYSSMRKKLRRNLHTELKRAREDDYKDLMSLMKNGKKGELWSDEQAYAEDMKLLCKNAWRVVRRNIFGESLSDIEYSRELIDKAMKNERGEYRYQRAFSDYTISYVDMICAKPEEDETLQIGSGAKGMLLISRGEEERGLILRDVTTILSASSNNNELVWKNPRDTMKAIVQCGTQYFGMCMLADLPEKEVLSLNLEKSNLTLDDILGSIKDTEKFAMTILGFTGADLLTDGVINFVPLLAEALSISVPAAGAIVAVILGAGTAKSIISDYNKMQTKHYQSYKNAIETVYDSLEEQYLETYDEYVSMLRNKIEKYLVECTGANSMVVDKQNVLISIKNIQDDLDAIRSEIKDDSYDPTKLIKG